LRLVLDNDVAYDPPGGGIHPSGQGHRAVAMAEQFRSRVVQSEASAVAHFDDLVAAARARGLPWEGTLTLRLHVAESLWANIEGTSWYWLLEPIDPLRLEEWRPRRARLEASAVPPALRRSR
jgi:hypothetical protein